MKALKVTTLALALAAAFPAAAQAQSNKELLNELRALKQRVTELEQKLKSEESKKAAAPATAAVAVPAAEPVQPGMTPDQQAEFNRIAVKAEALEDARDASGLRGLKISGYIDPTFIYNQRQDRAGFQFLNQVGDDGYNYDNGYFGMGQLDIQKEMDGGTKWRLTLQPNRGVGEVFSPGNIIAEASVSVPLTDLQTRFIAGQIPDWSGYEYLPGTQNKLITHNLLFDFTLPTAYTGAGMEITSGKWIVKGLLANMNASKKNSGNKAPVLAYRVDYAKGEFNGFGFAGVHGKAANLRADETDDTGSLVYPDQSGKDTALNLFELDGYFIRGDWTVQGQVSFGQQKKAAVYANPDTGELQDARWWGLSGLAAYKFTPQFEGIMRADYINNSKNGGGLLGYNFSDGRNGIGPGFVYDDAAGTWGEDPDSKGSNRYALTFGLGYAFNLNTVFKMEYRYDGSNKHVFENVKDGSYKKDNQLFGVATVVSF